MEKNKKHIEKLIESEKPILSSFEKDDIWQKISDQVNPSSKSHITLFSLFNTRYMTPIALALLLILGAGGTVAASDSARPGDFLFPIDRAIEDARIALATSDEDKAVLKLKFAEERIGELRSLLEEDDRAVKDNLETNATTSTNQLEFEADVFTDTTIVKVEINDQKSTFETSAKTREAVVNEIVSRYGIDRARVESALDFEVEDRASRLAERVNISDDVRVGDTLDLFESLALGLSDDARNDITKKLFDEISNNSRIEIDSDRIEIREGDNRIRVREKDGEIRIDVKTNSRDDISGSIIGDDSGSSLSSSFLEFEADVFTDTTIVKVEINDQKSTFETSAKTREAVVNEIVSRYGIDRARVESALDFEVEDRASRIEDAGDNRIRVEVRVEDGVAEVRLEYGDRRDEFEMPYSNREALISNLAARSGLSPSVISGSLDLEIRN